MSDPTRIVGPARDAIRLLRETNTADAIEVAQRLAEAVDAALSTTPAPLRQSCASCGHDDVDHAASGDGSCVAPDCWCAALSTTPAPDTDSYTDRITHEIQSNRGTHNFDSQCPFCFFDHFDAETRANLALEGAQPHE